MKEENPILDMESIKSAEKYLNNYRCANCGKNTKTLYLKMNNKTINDFKYEVIMTGVCEKCSDKYLLPKDLQRTTDRLYESDESIDNELKSYL